MKQAASDTGYHLKWDLIEDPFPSAWDDEIPGHTYNQAQTGKYLEVCLLQAGGDGTAIFMEDDIHRIYLASGGVPGKVNRLARQWLSDPADVAGLNSTERLPVISWFAGGTIGLGILLLLSWVIIPEGTSEYVAGRNVPVDLPAPPSPAAAVPREMTGESQATQSAPVEVAETLAAAVKKQEPARPPVTEKKPEPAKPTEPVASTQTETTAAKPETETKKESKEAVIIPGVKTWDWVNRQNGRSYVLQLIGAREPATIRRYIELSGLDKSGLALVKTGKDGKDWYVLLYGLYPDKARARQALQQLPDYAKQQGPWPRQLAELTQE